MLCSCSSRLEVILTSFYVTTSQAFCDVYMYIDLFTCCHVYILYCSAKYFRIHSWRSLARASHVWHFTFSCTWLDHDEVRVQDCTVCFLFSANHSCFLAPPFLEQNISVAVIGYDPCPNGLRWPNYFY